MQSDLGLNEISEVQGFVIQVQFNHPDLVSRESKDTISVEIHEPMLSLESRYTLTADQESK